MLVICLHFMRDLDWKFKIRSPFSRWIFPSEVDRAQIFFFKTGLNLLDAHGVCIL